MDADERKIKGIDMLGVITSLKMWRKETGNELELHPDDVMYFGHMRIIAGAWYSMASWLRLLDMTWRLCFGGTRAGAIEMGRISARQTYTTIYRTYIKQGDPQGTMETFVRNIGSHHNFGNWSIETSGTMALLKAQDYEEMNEAHGLLYEGWFEVILELAGAKMTQARVLSAPWRGDKEFRMEIGWVQP